MSGHSGEIGGRCFEVQSCDGSVMTRVVQGGHVDVATVFTAGETTWGV